MSKEDKTYYIGFLGSFSDSDLLALFRFIRKMTDNPDVVQSEAIDFFGELEDICHFLVWSRFTDIVTAGIYPPICIMCRMLILPYAPYRVVGLCPDFRSGIAPTLLHIFPFLSDGLFHPLQIYDKLNCSSALDPCLIRSKVRKNSFTLYSF